LQLSAFSENKVSTEFAILGGNGNKPNKRQQQSPVFFKHRVPRSHRLFMLSTPFFLAGLTPTTFEKSKLSIFLIEPLFFSSYRINAPVRIKSPNSNPGGIGRKKLPKESRFTLN